MKTEHLLVIRFSALGDVAMTVPVVYSVARQYPQLRITVLSKPFAKPFFEGILPNVSFMEADVKGEYHGVKGLSALFRRLTAKHFTAVADLHNVLRSNYLRMRFHIENTRVAHIDKHRKHRKQLTATHKKILRPIPTAFENYAEVFEKLGYPVQFDFTALLTPEQASLRLLPDAIGEKKESDRWIGIAPFAAHPGKAYPPEKMEQVIDALQQRHPDCRIFLFGGGVQEINTIDDITTRHTRCINASKLLNGLSEELILMYHLDVMVSMDSANMHFASLVNTPVVSIWGATHPYAGFMGWNQKAENTVQTDLPCRPCSIFGKKPCMRGDYACLHNIPPTSIVKHIERLIQ